MGGMSRMSWMCSNGVLCHILYMLYILCRLPVAHTQYTCDHCYELCIHSWLCPHTWEQWPYMDRNTPCVNNIGKPTYTERELETLRICFRHLTTTET